MSERVVVTGLGVVSPNGIGIPQFKTAIQEGISGIRFFPELKELNFRCQIAGAPEVSEDMQLDYFTSLELRKFNSSDILFGVIAGMDAWEDAGLTPFLENNPDWDSGAIFGIGGTSEMVKEGIHLVDNHEVKRLGSNYITQTMPSGITAYLGGKLGLGNQVTVSSSACSAGTESILIAYERIQQGKAKRMLAGGTNSKGSYTWAGFDTLRVATHKHNHEPEKASRPMDKDASGLVPSSGAGALVLESLSSALERGAHIYGEILGGHINSGGQRGSGSMTLANSEGAQRCIKGAIEDAGIHAEDIDLINGHLTSTGKCHLEIKNWAAALNRKGKNFPYITALKSITGHTLGAAGAIESVAAMLQLDGGFLIPNVNCEELDPEIEEIVDKEKILSNCVDHPIHIIAKSSFGFGDVNACVIFKRYESN